MGDFHTATPLSFNEFKYCCSRLTANWNSISGLMRRVFLPLQKKFRQRFEGDGAAFKNLQQASACFCRFFTLFYTLTKIRLR